MSGHSEVDIGTSSSWALSWASTMNARGIWFARGISFLYRLNSIDPLNTQSRSVLDHKAGYSAHHDTYIHAVTLSPAQADSQPDVPPFIIDTARYERRKLLQSASHRVYVTEATVVFNDQPGIRDNTESKTIRQPAMQNLIPLPMRMTAATARTYINLAGCTTGSQLAFLSLPSPSRFFFFRFLSAGKTSQALLFPVSDL